MDNMFPTDDFMLEWIVQLYIIFSYLMEFLI